MQGAAADVQAVAWARVYPALKRQYSKSLRQGVWYPVVTDERADRVTLQLGPRTVDVPRRLLELRADRPKHFSIVYRLERPSADRARLNLGKRYVACPDCGSRQAIIGHPEHHTCETCNHLAPVGWWEA